MKVKRYVVRSLPEALEKIRLELGKNAIILNTKKIRSGGFLGLFRREQFEVIAAADSEKTAAAEAAATALRSERQAAVPSARPHQPAASAVPAGDGDALIREIRELRSLVSTALEKGPVALIPAPFEKIASRLRKQEVDEGIISYLIGSALKEGRDWRNEETAYQYVYHEIIKILKNRMCQGINPFTRLYHFVGPTGVGKTTTIAKLAADLVINQRKKVGLVTADTYRIAAIDQLKTYAGILNAPLEVVFTPGEFQQSVIRLAGNDIILMDTAGRNYRNREYVNELSKMLSSSIPSETFLVLSLTTKYQDMAEIVRQFQEIGVDKVIFTKLDETTTYGSILNVCYYHPIQLSYITNGQSVPDDILLVSPEEIARWILRGREE